jgi:hypothetical protein
MRGLRTQSILERTNILSILALSAVSRSCNFDEDGGYRFSDVIGIEQTPRTNMPIPSGRRHLFFPDRLSDLANTVFLLTLFIGALATGIVIWTSKIKEANLARELSAASERAASLEKRAEELKSRNLALEEAISPRILEQVETSQKLKAFSDVSFQVKSPTDFEPRRAAGQIRYILSKAGWMKRILETSIRPDYFDGVHVRGWLGYLNKPTIDPSERQGSQRSVAAAAALVNVLNEAGIAAALGPPDPDIGPYAVLVEVGPKPLPLEMQMTPASTSNEHQKNQEWGNIDLSDE